MARLKVLGLLLAFGGAVCTASAQSDVDAVLAEAYKCDQNIRKEIVSLVQQVNAGHTELVDALVEASRRKDSIDMANIELVHALLADGLPSGLSRSSYGTIWLIIDHSGIEEQERYLPLMKKAARKGFISSNELATLCDRMDVYHGRRQKYGTQSYMVTVDGENICYIWPVKYPGRLNALRERIGTCTIEEYVELLRNMTGGRVVYNPELRVKDLPRMTGN